jgi:hypothetical protein
MCDPVPNDLPATMEEDEAFKSMAASHIYKPEEVGLTSIADVIRHVGEAGTLDLSNATTVTTTVTSPFGLTFNNSDISVVNSAPNGNGVITSSAATLTGTMPKGELVVTSAVYGQITDVVGKVDTLSAAIDSKLPEYDEALRLWMGQTIQAHMTGGEIKPCPKAVLDVGIRTSRFTLDNLYNHLKTGNSDIDEYTINTVGGFFTDMSKEDPEKILKAMSNMLRFSQYMEYIAINGLDANEYSQHVILTCGAGDIGDLTSYLDKKMAEGRNKREGVA